MRDPEDMEEQDMWRDEEPPPRACPECGDDDRHMPDCSRNHRNRPVCSPLCGAEKAYGRFVKGWQHHRDCPAYQPRRYPSHGEVYDAKVDWPERYTDRLVI